jgi:hypothetical protein
VQEVQSDGLLTQKSDVFSFGVILWELYNCTACYKRTNAGFHIRCAAFPRFPVSCPLPFAILAVACLNPEPASRCVPVLLFGPTGRLQPTNDDLTVISQAETSP